MDAQRQHHQTTPNTYAVVLLKCGATTRKILFHGMLQDYYRCQARSEFTCFTKLFHREEAEHDNDVS